jgi:hypothetical protein
MCKGIEVAKDSKKSLKSNSAWIPAPPKRSSAMPSLLSEVLMGAQGVFARQAGVAMSHERWKEIVGERVAQRTRVGKIYQRVLLVKVASSAWCQELSFLKPDLLRKLRLADFQVDDLRFKVNEMDDALTAGKKQQVRRVSVDEERKKFELSPDLEARLATVEDPNLRAAIAEAAKRSLSGIPAQAAFRRYKK